MLFSHTELKYSFISCPFLWASKHIFVPCMYNIKRWCNNFDLYFESYTYFYKIKSCYFTWLNKKYVGPYIYLFIILSCSY